MRISDWSSDVCSSDLMEQILKPREARGHWFHVIDNHAVPRHKTGYGKAHCNPVIELRCNRTSPRSRIASASFVDQPAFQFLDLGTNHSQPFAPGGDALRFLDALLPQPSNAPPAFCQGGGPEADSNFIHLAC